MILEGTKHGIWEKGKRLIWFSTKQIEDILNGTLDYRSFYTLEESKNEGVLWKSFDPPESFAVEEAKLRAEFSFCDTLQEKKGEDG